MAVAFDTLKLAQRLEAAGMPPQQAQGTAAALAESMTATLATAADVHEVELRLSGEIRESELRLRGEITGLRGETHEAEARLRAEIAAVRTEMAALRAELIRWAVGVGIAGVLAIGGMILSATLALLHALPHG
jgi:hypothetical protein